ncbi:MAG: hypoxanthine phosphoribosyltransferase [Fimbriimonadaceae bacterium]|nr:hypoxanthine phosphoribosyltransferase [Fimbriimonadaceae bacterium]QYK55442.1 MAG: hypoxanthine phosphoribosyltransferase [Fimbriimonadaceae bacterium]
MTSETLRMETLIGADDLARRCRELAQEIDEVYAGEPVVLIAVLNGAFVFVADLVRHMQTPLTVDFVQIGTYADRTESSGVFRFKKDHETNIEGRHVLVVEDIVDTGHTLSRLTELLRTRQPKSLRVATMLDKPSRRAHEALVDFVGFEVPDVFVVGYGLDYAERFRNLPHVAVLGF